MVGFCSVYNDPKEKSNRFVNLCVRPEYRHKGIGTALITRGINDLAAKGSNVVKLGADDINSEYFKFPKKFGFKEVKERTVEHFKL